MSSELAAVGLVALWSISLIVVFYMAWRQR